MLYRSLTLCVLCLLGTAHIDARTGNSWLLPHIPESPDWQTELRLDNPGPEALPVMVEIYRGGVEISRLNQTVPGRGQTSLVLTTGSWARINGPGADLALTATYTNTFGNKTALALTPSSAKTLRLMAPTAVDWTGLALLNPNNFEVKAKLTARTADGTLLADSTLVFPKGTRLTLTTESLFGNLEGIEIVDVSSSFPLAGLTITGVGEQIDARTAAQAPVAPQDIGLQAFLRDWYKDYNANQSLDYLREPYQTFPEGDPNLPGLPSHVFHQDVAYGPFPRNVVDFWQVPSTTPTPVVVFIHGGGFRGGDKSQIGEGAMRTLLEAGVSVAAINYRWSAVTEEAALSMPIPNGEGTEHDVNGARLDYILRDCARAIQFLRYQATAWNIDGSRIGSYGGSAGAGASVWIGSVPDLACPDHPDPVLRESTRIAAVGHTNSQPTYNFSIWPEILSYTPSALFEWIGIEDIRLLQKSRNDQWYTTEGRDLSRVLDYYSHLSADDPPIMTINLGEDLNENQVTNGSQVVHHPRSHVAIYEKCLELGITCEIRTRTLFVGPHQGNLPLFMIDTLKAL